MHGRDREVVGRIVKRLDDLSLDFEYLVNDGRTYGLNLHFNGLVRWYDPKNITDKNTGRRTAFSIKEYPRCPRWQQFWPSEARITAIAIIRIATNLYRLPREIARRIGKCVYAKRYEKGQNEL